MAHFHCTLQITTPEERDVFLAAFSQLTLDYGHLLLATKRIRILTNASSNNCFLPCLFESEMQFRSNWDLKAAHGPVVLILQRGHAQRMYGQRSLQGLKTALQVAMTFVLKFSPPYLFCTTCRCSRGRDRNNLNCF